MKKIITILFIFLCLNTFNAQVIYLNTNSDDIYKLDINTCQYEFVVHVFYNITDISFHSDGSFYGLTNVGQLIRIDTVTGTANVIHDFDGQAFNSLTISGNGTIYATGDQGELWSYNLISDQPTYHGDFGYRATGDLTFYKGNLYVAVEADRIVLIDINNPPNSSIAIDENIQGEIFGIVSYADNCDSINCYAISSGQSSIYLIDFNNQSLQLLCNLDIRAGGGASTYEFLGSSPIVFNDIQTTDPTCISNDGSITMNISGGNAPLTYSINDTLLQPSNTFDNLPGGSYTIMVTDANGCTYATDITLPEKNGPSIDSLNLVDPICNSTNGSITMNISGGTEPYIYSLNNILLQSSNTFDNLSGGTYSIMVTDANECTIALDLILHEKDGPTIEDLAIVEPICNEIYGQINVLANSGNGALEYSIDGINFQSSPLFDQVISGWYIITVRDSAGCMDFDSTKIFEVPPARIDSVIVQSPGCNNFKGALTIVTENSLDVTFSIDGVNFQEENTFDQLLPGNYLITMRDENGCTDTLSIIIDEALPLLIEDIQTSPTSCGQSNGSIFIMTSGGAGQVQYSINNIHPQTSNEFINLASGEIYNF